ncbi:MAG: hypothetical protein LH481_06050 [Burkholderiales bacterium]|nr:hypothetical protein [Burkholderiales bacterium]
MTVFRTADSLWQAPQFMRFWCGRVVSATGNQMLMAFSSAGMQVAVYGGPDVDCAHALADSAESG